MRYSPKPKEDYVRQTASGPVGLGTFGDFESEAVWNLFWISEPLLDIAIETSSDNGYPKYSDLIHPCWLEVTTNKELAKMLETLTALEFVEALKGMDYREMEPYKLLGEQWIAVMESRVRPPRGVIESSGNVLSVNFGANVFKLPKGISACNIMTLSLTKH